MKFKQSTRSMLIISETFELLLDKNNNVAYKALLELQKESEETDGAYCYMEYGQIK